MSYTTPKIDDQTKIYSELLLMADAFLQDESDAVSAMANLSALLYDLLPDLNWAGFYRARETHLILGPFQGKPACTKIPKGSGVCGTAWQTEMPQVVPDVHAFPGHIACDSASNSELVIPIRNPRGEFCALLDLDSPLLGRFTVDDLEGLLSVIERLENWMKKTDINQL